MEEPLLNDDEQLALAQSFNDVAKCYVAKIVEAFESKHKFYKQSSINERSNFIGSILYSVSNRIQGPENIHMEFEPILSLEGSQVLKIIAKIDHLRDVRVAKDNHKKYIKTIRNALAMHAVSHNIISQGIYSSRELGYTPPELNP